MNTSSPSPNLLLYSGFTKGIKGYPKISIASWDDITSKIDYFKCNFLTDGSRPHPKVVGPNKESNPRILGKNMFTFLSDFISRLSVTVMWHETLYCPGLNNCIPQKEKHVENKKHNKCYAVFKLIIFDSYPNDFHVVVQGGHGPNFTVKPDILRPAQEVSIIFYLILINI
jgi:hypothetical protein